MPKSKEQYQQIKDARKIEMIECATTLFSVQNYHRVSVDTITDQLKCSHGLFYHYFKNKEDIFTQVIDQAVARMVSLFDRKMIDQLRGAEAFERLIDNLFKILKSENTYDIAALNLILNLSIEPKDNYPDKLSQVIEKCKKSPLKIAEYLTQAKEDGDFNIRIPDEAALTIIALLKGLAYARMNMPLKYFRCSTTVGIMNLLRGKKNG